MKYLSLFSGIGGFEIGITNALLRDRSTRPECGGSEESLLSVGTMSTAKDTRATCIGYSEIDPYADAIYKYNFGGRCGNNENTIRETSTGLLLQPEGDNVQPTGRDSRLNTTSNKNNHGGNLGDCTKIDPTTIPDFDLLVGGFPCQAFSIAGKRRGFDDTRGTLIFDILRILKEKQPRHFILENVKGLLSHDSGNTFRTIITALAELGYAVEWQVLNAKNFGVPQNRERVFIVGHLGGFGGRQVFPIREANRKDIEQLNQPRHSNDRVYSADGISPTLNTMQGGNRQPFVDIYNKRVRSECPSLTMPEHNSIRLIDKFKIRKLTPTECERLMGYPDDWTKYGLYDDQVKNISDTQRYKCCGNGVVSNVVEEIVKRLYKEEL